MKYVCRKIDHVSKFWDVSFFRLKILRWLKIGREIEFEAKMNRILSYLRIFQRKEMSHLRILTSDRFFEQKFNEKLNGWNFELSQNHIHIPSCDKSPSMTFGTISKYLRYTSKWSLNLIEIENSFWYILPVVTYSIMHDKIFRACINRLVSSINNWLMTGRQIGFIVWYCGSDRLRCKRLFWE